jgi:hypothetical protein
MVTIATGKRCVTDEQASTVPPVATKNSEGMTSIQISTAASEGMDVYCGKARIKRQTISQVLLNFLRLPPAAQKVMEGMVTPGMEREYAKVLEALAAQVRASAGKPHKRVGYVMPEGGPPERKET